MSSEQNSSRWLRVPWRLVGAAVLLILIALLWWSGTRTSPLDQEITRRLAELRSSGEPVDADGLARLFPNPPPSEDAGVLLTNIMLFAADNRVPASSPVVNANMSLGRTNPIPEPALTELRAYHEQTKAVWGQWPQPWPTGVRFASHWERGMMSNSLPPFVQVRALAHVLNSLAMMAAEDNQPTRAAELLERSFQFADTLPSDSLVAHMIGVACLNLSTTTAERCLNHVVFTDEHLRRLDRSLPPPSTNRFSHALRGEHCIAIWGFQEVKAGVNIDHVIGTARDRRWWVNLWNKFKPGRKAYRDEDFLRYLDLYRPSQAMLDLPATQAVVRAKQLTAAYASNITSLVGGAVPANWIKALQVNFESQAKLSVLKTSFAIERFRLAHAGKIPTGLPQLVPDFLPSVPRDLFDGQPLRFKTLPRGYVVYSLGADGVDDGGLEKTNYAARYDVTIRV
jgi:hypothetical protein